MIQFIAEPNEVTFSKDAIVFHIKLDTEKYCSIEIENNDLPITSLETGIPNQAGEMTFNIAQTIDDYVTESLRFDETKISEWVTDIQEQTEGLRYIARDAKNVFFEEFTITIRSYDSNNVQVNAVQKSLKVFLGSSGNDSFFSPILTMLGAQPTEKPITVKQPELMYLYTQVELVPELEIIIHLTTGEKITWQFLENRIYPGQVLAMKSGYQDILKIAQAKSEGSINQDSLLKYSVQWKSGSQEARKQTYVLMPGTRYERNFLFWGSGGVWETLSATGLEKVKTKIDQAVSKKEIFIGGRQMGKQYNYLKAVNEMRTLEIGFQNRKTRQWSRSFLESHERYKWDGDTLKSVVITSKSYPDMGDDIITPESIKFTYEYAEQNNLFFDPELVNNAITSAFITLTGYAQNSNSIQLNWTGQDIPNSPVFEVWKGSDPANLTLDLSNIFGNGHLDTGVLPSTKYYYRIQEQSGVFSNLIEVETPAVSLDFTNVIMQPENFVWGTHHLDGYPILQQITWGSNLMGSNSTANDFVRVQVFKNDLPYAWNWEGSRGSNTNSLDMTYYFNGPFGQTAGWPGGNAGEVLKIKFYTEDFIGLNQSVIEEIIVTIPTI
ncbi:hypothetical protein BKI52_12460 [marine bacterium AO1-C]|nr:hypothetical protein BKI52_12460 [marine bacterium AO1-C]